VGRAVVPPGEYEGDIRYVNASGLEMSRRKIDNFTVQAGEKKIMIHQTLQ
jgi:hypothetical protein